eukprot:1144659-Pyramimonas_sp.AAC.1
MEKTFVLVSYASRRASSGAATCNVDEYEERDEFQEDAHYGDETSSPTATTAARTTTQTTEERVSTRRRPTTVRPPRSTPACQTRLMMWISAMRSWQRIETRGRR